MSSSSWEITQPETANKVVTIGAMDPIHQSPASKNTCKTNMDLYFHLQNLKHNVHWSWEEISHANSFSQEKLQLALPSRKDRS